MQSLQIRPAVNSLQGAGEGAGGLLRSEWKGRVGQVLGVNPLPAPGPPRTAITRAAGTDFTSSYFLVRISNAELLWTGCLYDEICFMSRKALLTQQHLSGI